MIGESARKVRGYRADEATHGRLQAEAARQNVSINEVLSRLVATLPGLPPHAKADNLAE